MMKKKFSNKVRSMEISGIREMFSLRKEDTINLALGEPYFATPPKIKEAAIKAIQNNKTHYTDSKGILELREKLGEKYGFSAEEIIITCGASEALYLAMATFLDEGDEIIVPDPGFVSYFMLPKLCNAKIVPFKLTDDFRIDIERLQEVVTKRTKLMVINSPSNPTGVVYTKKELKGIAEIAEDNDIIVLSDEVYEQFVYEAKHYSIKEFTDKCIIVNAFSKTFSMTGWRIGFVMSQREIIDQMLKPHQYLNACAPSIAQYAVLASFEVDCKYMVEEFRKNRDLVYTKLRKFVKCVKPEGAFYIFPQINEGYLKKFIEKGVLVVPGSVFGKNGKGHMRISFGIQRDKLEEGINRIIECLERG